MNFIGFFFALLILSLPILSIVYFIVCLVRYCSARKSWKQCPDESREWYKMTCGKKLRIASLMLGAWVALWAYFIVMFSRSIAYM